MKKYRKQILAMLLAAVLALSLLPVSALAENPQDDDPYIYMHDADIQYWHRSPHRYSYADSSGISHTGYVPAMYRLVSMKDGSELPVYCCDLVTSIAEVDTKYKRLNLEDAGYYSADAAAHIRGILKNGYWVGRDNLAALESNAGASGLTAAEALSATQCAIWHYANTQSLASVYSGTMSIKNTSGIKDTVTVDVNEGGQNELTVLSDTNDNIQKVYAYLISQSAAPSSVIWSFEGNQVILTAKSGLDAYDVAVKFKMKGSTTDITSLSLTASLTNNAGTVETKSFQLLQDNTLTADAAGYYTITFENVKDSALNDTAKIQLKLSGTQAIQDDVYFYEPVGGRDTAQCFVGYGAGTTPVSCEASLDVVPGTTSLSLYKYDASMSDNTASRPMAGVTFALYVSVNGGAFVPYPGMEPQTTGSDGIVTWEGLVKTDNIQYAYKEVTSPDGYLSQSDTLGRFGTDGIDSVGNCHALGDLIISKRVVGTGDHFRFQIALDFSAADLVTGNALTEAELAAQYSTLSAVYDGTDDCSETHSDSVSFTAENDVYTALVSLADGESVTLKDIPVGTGYTVTELDENGGALTAGQAAKLSDKLYVCPDTQQSGAIDTQTAELCFTNLEYESGSLLLSGKKYLNGSPSAQAFSFSLTDVSDASRPVLLQTVQNDKNGIILFDAICYEKAGTYTYEVKETSSGGGYSCDTTVYTVTVSVTQDEDVNKLTVSAPVITKSGAAENVNEIIFYNNTTGGGGGSSYTSVTAKKIWKLDDGGKAADSATVALLRNGTQQETVVLNESNHWTYTWNRLNDNYRWTVEEIDVPDGFTVSVEQKGTTFVITNNDSNTPDTPDIPDTPDTPGTPDTPNNPDTPDTPTTSNTKDKETATGTPDTAGPHLPQTGLQWWPICLLAIAGVLTLFIGRTGRKASRDDT